jgi:hydrogenase maturation protease
MDIRVLGIGNVLMGDDGFGPYVIEALNAAYDFPPRVSLIDVGTPGLDLAPYLIGADAVIVLDTVRSDGAAGELRRYRRDALIAHPPPQRLGPHDPGFTQMLLTLDFAGVGPQDVVLVGVIPKSTAPLPRLSGAVFRAVPAAVRAVVAELDRLGAKPALRPVPSAFAPWWETVARV